MKNEYIIGIASALVVSASALIVSTGIPGLGSATAALVLGLAVGNLTGIRSAGKAGLRFCQKKLLNWSIALMGFELNLSAAADLGAPASAVIAGVILSSLLLGMLFARSSGLPSKLAFLLGVGNGICGSAAIAACAPVIDAREDDVGISVAVINLLGAVAIFLIPGIASLLGLGIDASALLVGGTIQSVGQTLAAAMQAGESIVPAAMMVKMGRVIMLGFVVVLISIRRGKGEKARFPLPPFIAVFLFFGLLTNALTIPRDLLSAIETAKKGFLYPAMAAIGMEINLKSIREFGVKAFLSGLVIFAFNIILVLIITNVLL